MPDGQARVSHGNEPAWRLHLLKFRLQLDHYESYIRMDMRLARLISDFQSSVVSAVALMHRSGLPLPHSAQGWSEADVPSSGILEGNIRYYKHGYGCEVELDTGTVDFDFGRKGEVDGFDEWRLGEYAAEKLDTYGFGSVRELYGSFETEVALNTLVRQGYGLYYIADLPRVLATDVDCRLPGDNLPHRDKDRVLVLHTHYFLTADLMHENYEKLKKKYEGASRLARNDEINYRIYLVSWLGFLAVACEGFKNLSMRVLLKEQRPAAFMDMTEISDRVGRLMNIHAGSLSKFRNNVFHLRDSPEMIQQFFARDAERLPWAHELHVLMKKFFSRYRVECELHYVLNQRQGERGLTRKQLERMLCPGKRSSSYSPAESKVLP